MTVDGIAKRFPKFFQNFEMPSPAKEQEIKVFRACRTRRIEKESFLPTYVENGYKITVGGREDDPMQYSLSSFIKAKDLKRFVVLDSRYQPPWTLAVGVTHPMCGVSCMTREYLYETSKQRKSNHVDWWLYEEATPWIYFKEIDYDEAK